jgi:hypothetical protein
MIIDAHILFIGSSLALVIDVVVLIYAFYRHYMKRTLFSAAHCACPALAFLWIIATIVYTKQDETKIYNFLDFYKFSPFWMIIFFILMLIFHWKLMLLVQLLSRYIPKIQLYIYVSLAIGVLTFFLHIILFIISFSTTNTELETTCANLVAQISVVYLIQDAWGLLSVIISIR